MMVPPAGMSATKHVPNQPPPRFSVERDGAGFVILDRIAVRYMPCDPGTSRTQADQLCAAWNLNPALRVHIPKGRKKRGAVSRAFLTFDPDGYDPKHSDVLADWIPDHMVARMAAELGLTVPELLADSFVISDEIRRRYAEEYEASRRVPATPSTGIEDVVRTHKAWLPAILTSWADAVAAQRGYAGDMRAAWGAPTILELIDDELLEYRDVRAADLRQLLDRKLMSPKLNAEAREYWTHHFEKQIRQRIGPPSIDELVHGLMIPGEPIWQMYDDDEKARRLCRFLSVHYLSGEIADVKAAAFGLQRRAYLLKIREAHELVAPQIHQIRPVS